MWLVAKVPRQACLTNRAKVDNSNSKMKTQLSAQSNCRSQGCAALHNSVNQAAEDTVAIGKTLSRGPAPIGRVSQYSLHCTGLTLVLHHVRIGTPLGRPESVQALAVSTAAVACMRWSCRSAVAGSLSPSSLAEAEPLQAGLTALS